MEMNKHLWNRRLAKQDSREWSESLQSKFAELQEVISILDEAYTFLMLNVGTPGYAEANTYHKNCNARADKVFLDFMTAYTLDLATSVKQLEKELG